MRALGGASGDPIHPILFRGYFYPFDDERCCHRLVDWCRVLDLRARIAQSREPGPV